MNESVKFLLLVATLGLILISCKTPQEKISPPPFLKGNQIPKTISSEAQAFLKETKGNIINNYILDSSGNGVLADRHRTAAPDMQLQETRINGVKAFWVSSKKTFRSEFVIIYLHGGGFVVGAGDEDAGIIYPVFEEAGVRGLSVDYRLAPKHPFPAAVEDAKNIFLGLLENGYRAEQIALAGDSAGGNLAIAATLALKEDGQPMPGAIIAIAPGVLDMKVLGDTFATLSDSDPFESTADILANIEKYRGEALSDNPLMSPLYGDLEGFPPMLIQVGTRDLLLSDSVRLARKARGAGVKVTLDVWEGMWHVWHMTWPDVPEARQACKEIAEFVHQHLDINVEGTP